MVSSRYVWTTSIIAMLLAACSGPSENASTGETVSPATCSSRCGEKAKKCGATPSQGTSICGRYCGKSLTEETMTCLEAESCGVLSAGTSQCEKQTSPSSSKDAGAKPSPKRPPAPDKFGNDCKCPSAGGVVIYCTDNKSCGSSLKCASGAKCSYECKDNDDCPSGSICTVVTVSSGSTRWCL